MTDQETIATLRSALRKAEEERDAAESRLKKITYAITGGKLSKPNYDPSVVIAHYEDEVTSLSSRAEKAESELAEARKRLGEMVDIGTVILSEDPPEWRGDLGYALSNARKFLAQQEAGKSV